MKKTAEIALFEKRERLKLERDQRQKSFVEKIRQLKEEFEEDERMRYNAVVYLFAHWILVCYVV